MSIVLVGSTSGSVTLQEPAVAGTTVIDLPATSGTMAVTGGSPSFASMTVTGNANFATSSGNVGIGTSSPTSLLHVSGNTDNVIASKVVNLSTGTFAQARSEYTSTGYTFIVGSSNVSALGAGGFLYTTGAQPIAFFTNNTERMRINSSGNVLLGQSTLPFSNANFANGSIYVNGNAFLNNSSGTSQYNVRLDGFQDQLFVVWANGDTQNNAIYYAYGGTAWVNSSDEALKDIIEPITNAVDKVSQLRAVIGKFKTEEESARHPFLIAQDVQKVLPEAVYANKSRIEGEADTLGVGYTDVIPLLVAAIKELKAQLDESNLTLTSVKAELDQAKAEIQALKETK